MARSGFGFPTRRVFLQGILAAIGAPRIGVPPLSLAPNALWDGMAGSGFADLPPLDPLRSTAKPACRLLTPERQWFNSTLDVGVSAAANNQGTLLNLGLEKVVFHFEGTSIEVTAPSFHSLSTTAGPRTYLGWWARLQKPAGLTGFGHLYVEAVPADPTMQSRVIGPYTFGLQDVLHDVSVDIAPSQPEVIGTSYQSIMAALPYIRSQGAQNPRVRLIEAGSYDLTDDSGPNNWSVPGYLTIEMAHAGAKIARQGPYVDDSTIIMDLPRYPVRFKGGTIDFEFIGEIRAGGFDGCNWLDGCTLTSTAPSGKNMPRRGEVPNTAGALFDDRPWITECDVSQIHVFGVGASLVRGCAANDISQDIVSGARCVISSTFQNHDNDFWNTDTPAFTATYTGAEPTATLERTGGTEGNEGGEYVATYGANEARFRVAGNGFPSADYFSGAQGDGYWFSDVVDWLNSLPGWSATLLDDTFKAAVGSIAGGGGLGFEASQAPNRPAQDVKDSVLTVVSHTDKHGDWYQHATGNSENVICYGNRGWQIETQHIFLSPTGNGYGRDMLFFANAFSRGQDTANLSQFGRPNVKHSHIVVAHCTFADQGIAIRTDNAGYDLDSYCLFKNLSVKSFGWSQGVDQDATVENIHLHSGSIPPVGAANVSVGGDEATLYADHLNGDFTPQGDLLTNGHPRILPFDLFGAPFSDVAPPGAVELAGVSAFVAPPPSQDPLAELLALMNASTNDSEFFDYKAATVAPIATITGLSDNANSQSQATASRRPDASSAGAAFDHNDRLDQPVTAGMFTVVMTVTLDGTGTVGNLVTSNSGFTLSYDSASTTNLGLIVRVDGVAVGTRQDLYNALNGQSEAIVRIEGINTSSGTDIRIGRSSSGMRATVGRAAILDEAALGSDLTNARDLAEQAVVFEG